MREVFFPILFFCLTLMSSCIKDKQTILISNSQSLGEEIEIHSLTFPSLDSGFFVGGNRFFKGVYGQSFDGGNSWLIDSVAPAILFGLAFDEAKKPSAVGIYNRIATVNNSNTWYTNAFSPEKTFNGIDFNNQGKNYIVGGGSFANGGIYSYDFISGQLDSIRSFNHELMDIHFLEDGSGIIVGYGVVLRTNNHGGSWDFLDIDGDFFRAIHFPSQSIGYIIGSSGSILKSTDGGKNWKKIRNGNNLLVSNKAFRALYFSDENYGFIAGERGMVWKTTDGGETWVVIEDLPKEDFTSVSFYNGFWFLGSKNGSLIQFQDIE